MKTNKALQNIKNMHPMRFYWILGAVSLIVLSLSMYGNYKVGYHSVPVFAKDLTVSRAAGLSGSVITSFDNSNDKNLYIPEVSAYKNQIVISWPEHVHDNQYFTAWNFELVDLSDDKKISVKDVSISQGKVSLSPNTDLVPGGRFSLKFINDPLFQGSLIRDINGFSVPGFEVESFVKKTP